MSSYNKISFSRRKFLRRSALLFPLAVIPGLTLPVFAGQQSLHRTVFAMGTAVGIHAYGTDRRLLRHAMNKAFAELYRLDELLSLFKESSIVSAINAAAGRTDIAAPSEVRQLLRHAVRYSDRSNGLFDITVEPLMKLWGFRNEQQTITPTDREIEETLRSVGWKNIILEGPRIGLMHHHTSIDLGGIAVGFTLEKMASLIRSEGVESALINHSGDIYAIGVPPESDGWQVKILSPLDPNETIRTVSLKNAALSTSSASEQFRQFGEQRAGHIMNGISGRPANELLSVSVIAPSPMDADVFSTAYFCSPVDRLSACISGAECELIVMDQQKTVHNLSIG